MPNREMTCSRCSLILSFTLLAAAAGAQKNPLQPPSSSLVDLESNGIIFRGDSSAFVRYHEKLDQLIFSGEGRINVVHIGGSHVQADMWSMELRHRLQTMAPGVRSGRGLIFPYSMAKSNNPWWYQPAFTGSWTSVKNVQRTDSSELGLTGYAVSTRDTLTQLDVSFRGDAYAGYPFNRIKVLHRMDSSYAVEAWSPDSTVVIVRTVHEAEGYTEFSYSDHQDTLHLQFVRRDTLQTRFTLFGILMESDDPGFVLHAIGVNGASTPSYLRCQRFTEDLALLKPDLVIFSVGINDAHDADFRADRYRKNYEELIARVRAAAPDAAILLTSNTDSFMKRKYVNKNSDDVLRVMLEISATHGCGVWDMWHVMGGSGSIRSWEKAGLAKRDRVHFTRQGYVLFGDLLFSALMDAYADHLRSRATP